MRKSRENRKEDGEKDFPIVLAQKGSAREVLVLRLSDSTFIAKKVKTA